MQSCPYINAHEPVVFSRISGYYLAMQSSCLTNQFLIAMPQLADPNFSHSVIYIFSHNADGALGILINKPLDLELGEIFTQMALAPGTEALEKQSIYHGGPVQTDCGFVLHQADAEWQSSIQIGEEIEITTSRDILEAIAKGQGPRQTLVALGYAGWGAGQLEQEIKDNAWLSSPASTDIMFNTPAPQRWAAAAKLLGITLENLSPDIGHA